MLIRSQDKRGLINLKNVAEIYIDIRSEGQIIATFGDYYSQVTELGNYSTKEKAIKVLDMIQSEYTKTTDLKHEFNSNILFCVPMSHVFNMPQDSEV